ncbi:MAG: hypothetical protein ACOYME_14335, partial [Prochlorotrichaceae cyanobacterium]
LYSIRAWWRALPSHAQADQANLETLVQLTENVIQAENAGWVQEMRDALSDMYGDKDKTATDDGQKADGHKADGQKADAPADREGDTRKDEQPGEPEATSIDRPQGA